MSRPYPQRRQRTAGDQPVHISQAVRLLLARYGIDPEEVRRDEPRPENVQRCLEFARESELVGHC